MSSRSGSSKGYKGAFTSKKLEPKKLSTIQKEEEERKELNRQQQEKAALQEQLQEVRLQKWEAERLRLEQEQLEQRQEAEIHQQLVSKNEPLPEQPHTSFSQYQEFIPGEFPINIRPEEPIIQKTEKPIAKPSSQKESSEDESDEESEEESEESEEEESAVENHPTGEESTYHPETQPEELSSATQSYYPSSAPEPENPNPEPEPDPEPEEPEDPEPNP